MSASPRPGAHTCSRSAIAMAARLVLEDGSLYVGTLFGAAKSVPGEVGELDH